jgi:uncharacterized protein (DUF488 family)
VPTAGRIFTIGHSSHEPEAFLALLARHGVRLVADVRRFPGSRRNPQYGAEALAAAAPGYAHLPELGGRRRPRPGTPNDGWEVEAFRGYADHMASEEFAAGLTRLEELARQTPTAIMCAEAPWWKCHRRLVADALLVHGWTVCHIGPDGRLTEHALPDFAVVDDDGLRYPSPQLRL